MNRYTIREKESWLKTFLTNYNQAKTAKIHNIPASTLNVYLQSIDGLILSQISPDEYELWLNLYCSGFRMMGIESITKRSRTILRKFYRDTGIYDDLLDIKRDYGEEISNLNNKGLGAIEIAERINISHQGVHKYLFSVGEHRDRNESLELKLTEEDKYFDSLDTQEKVYWLGFIVADGHFAEHTLRIILSELDYDHLKKLAHILKVKKIKRFERITKKGNVSKMINLDYNSVHMVRTAIKYNLRGNKAHNPQLGEIYKFIPEKYVNHFIRGYWDGDGTLGAYMTKRGNYKRATSCTGNHKFLETTNKVISNYTEIKKKKVYRIKSSHFSGHLCYQAKLDIKVFLLWLYRNSEICLERKYKKANQLLELC